MRNQLNRSAKFLRIAIVTLFVSMHSFFEMAAQGFIIYQDKTFGVPPLNIIIGNHIICFQEYLYLIGVTRANPGGDQTDSLCGGVLQANNDLWLIKTDLQLNKIWDIAIGGNKIDDSPYMFLNDKDQIIISCRSNSDSSCEKSENVRQNNVYDDYWVIAYDTNGNKLWDKTIGGSAYESWAITAQLTSGNYITCGESGSSSFGYDKSVTNWGQSDYWCVKHDSAGNKIWDQVYGGIWQELSGNDSKQKNFFIIADEDDSFVLAGSTTSPVSGNISQPKFDVLSNLTDIWLIKIDSLGNKIWDRRYGGDLSDYLSGGIKKTQDGYIVVGITGSNQSGSVSQPPIGGLPNQDVWVLKLDTAGNKIWDRRYGGTGNDFSRWFDIAIDGGYLISAQTNSPAGNDISESPYGLPDYWIFKIDTTGNKLWDKRFGGPGSNRVTNFIQIPDTSIYLFGSADSGTTTTKTDPGKGQTDYWVVHFKYTNGPTSMEETIYGTGHFAISPNPATSQLTVQYSPVTKPGKAILFNSLGEAVTEINLPPNSSTQKINISSFPSGIYLLRLESEQYSGSKKFVKF